MTTASLLLSTGTRTDAPAPRPDGRVLREHGTCQQLARANRFKVLIDAADYYAVLRATMPLATRSIHIIGWDIDSRLKLVPGTPQDDLPEGLADFLCALAENNRHLRIHILAWDFAMLYAFEREWLPVYKMGWRTHRRIRFRQDGRHPLGGSHHQKIVVIDDRLAFAGGIDLTRSRWDTPEHDPRDTLRRNADNAPYQPMHDVQAMFDGDAAHALSVLVRERWRRATNGALRETASEQRASDLWPPHVEPDIEDVELGISLTEPAYEGRPAVEQIQQLYLDAIDAAKDNIYIENQYFTASRVGAALAARLAADDGPDLAVVGPERQSGWLQEATMGVLRAKLHESLKRTDRHGRYAMYAPTIGGTDDETIINVHSKLMTVDDELLVIGSANLNNRSMVLDTECNITLEARGEPRVQAAIASVRNRLLAEHLDVTPGDVQAALEHHRLNAAIATLRHGERTLMPLDPVVSGDLEDLAARVSVLDAEAPVAPHELVRHFVPEERSRPLTGKLLAFGTLSLMIVLLAVLWRFTPLGDAISFSALVHAAQRLHASSFGPVAIVALYALAASISVPVTLLIAVSGLVFGALAGSAYAFTGTMISAFIMYTAGAALGHDAVRKLAGGRLNRISEKLGKRGLIAMIVLRVVPIAPFTVINLAAGASHIGLRDFLLGTALGMAPGIVLATTFAHQLVAAVRHPSLSGLALVALVGAALIGLSIALQRFFSRRS